MKKVYKKYPNRRLYDVEKSAYVNVDDVKRSVLSFVDVEVIDVKTEEDITTSVLLQILNQQDMSSGGNKIITAQTLSNLIRLYEHPLGAMMSASIESMMQLVSQQMSTVNNTQNQRAQTQQQYIDMWQQAWSAFLPRTNQTNPHPKNTDTSE